MATPEPGWYPNPEDPSQARYWDGMDWTDHVHPVDETPVASDTPRPWTPPGAPPTGAWAPHGAVTGASGQATPAARGAVVAVVAVLALVAGGMTVAAGLLGSSSSVPPDVVTTIDEPVEIESVDDVTPPAPRDVDPAALDAAGCVSVDPGDGADRTHFDLAGAPPASEIYDVALPAWGPHAPEIVPVLPEPSPSPLDPRVLLHNLEHGAVAVWFDPDAHSPATVDDMADWMRELVSGGFTGQAGSSIYVSPAPAEADVAPISLRAWGVALDCPGWDAAAADAFVAAHYGSRGEAPEGMLGPYPEDGPLLDP